MVKLRRIALEVGLAICLLCVSLQIMAEEWTSLPVKAEGWTQFRGPNGQGRCASTDLPVSWSGHEGIVWKTLIPGRGWSSPVTLDGNIWLTTATESGHSLRA